MNNKSNIVIVALQGGFRHFCDLHEGEQSVVKRVLELRDASIMIGAEEPAGAIVYARDGGSYGAAGNVDSHAAITALTDARRGGARSVTLAVSVPDNRVLTPLSDEVLEALGAFGDSQVLLIGEDRSVVMATTAASAAA